DHARDLVDALDVDQSGIHVHRQHLALRQAHARRHEGGVHAMLLAPGRDLRAQGIVVRNVEQPRGRGAELHDSLGLGQRGKLFGLGGAQGGGLDDEMVRGHVRDDVGPGSAEYYFRERSTARTASARAGTCGALNSMRSLSWPASRMWRCFCTSSMMRSGSTAALGPNCSRAWASLASILTMPSGCAASLSRCVVSRIWAASGSLPKRSISSSWMRIRSSSLAACARRL